MTISIGSLDQNVSEIEDQLSILKGRAWVTYAALTALMSTMPDDHKATLADIIGSLKGSAADSIKDLPLEAVKEADRLIAEIVDNLKGPQ